MECDFVITFKFQETYINQKVVYFFMSELIKKRVKESLSKTILVFLNNNFRFEGKLTNYDDDFLEILDYKTNSYKIIKFADIKELEVKE